MNAINIRAASGCSNWYQWLATRLATLIMAAMLAACGGGSSGTNALDDGQAGTSDNQTVTEFSQFLSQSFGNKGAFDAVFLALDKGYSLDQIVIAGIDDRLTTEGVVFDELGGVGENPGQLGSVRRREFSRRPG